METPYKVLTTFDTHVATAKAGTFVVVQDEVAYVAGGLGLAIIDVSAPQSPKLITVVNTGVATRDYGGAVAVDGGLAYFVGNLGLAIIDVSPATKPIKLSTTKKGVVAPKGGAYIAVSKGFAYVASALGLVVVDVSSPKAPIVLTTVSTGVPTALAGHFVTIVDETAYVTGGQGVSVINIATPATAARLGTVDTTGGVKLVGRTSLAIANKTLYFASELGLTLFKVPNAKMDTQRLATVTGIALKGTGAHVHVAGTTAYYASGLGLTVIDVANPKEPKKLMTLPVKVAAGGCCVAQSGASMFLFSGGKGLALVEAAASGNKMDTVWDAYETKMKAEKLSGAAIAAFKYNLGVLTSGANLMIAEGDIEPVASLPDYNSLTKEDPSLLTTTVMVKLNGGLGTGMGLEKAKSLLDLKDGNTFLDFIAQQVMNMRTEYKTEIAFMLMNSFATSADTLEHLSKYEKLALPGLDLEFQQNKAPKVTEKDLTPASWPAKPDCEWCPPGHGDLYPAMLGTNTLDNLLAKGYKYMFVSNSDNLGATMDLKLLTWFAESGAPFAMECAARTEADKKGGHLATSKATNGLLLREAAQCPDEDEKAFQDTSKYKYFNTNNLWVDLQKLKETMDKNDGVLPLPVIKNGKTVDPRDKKSTKVLQLETAMGAAIASFEGAAAIQIPRERFAPVKTTNDMLALMSDAYMVTPDYRMVLVEERAGVPPNIKLDGIYKFVDQLQKLVPNGPPSLVKCKKLTIEGDVAFAKGVIFVGEVKVINEPDEFGGVGCKVLEAGTYTDTTVTL